MSALLKTFPFKGSHHLCDATCIVVVIPDESCSATLSSFQLSYVDFSVWVPNSCCIFQMGPDECLVGGVLDVLRTVGQVSAKKGSGVVYLLGNCINMCIPRQCVTDQDSQVLCILGVSKFFALLTEEIVTAKTVTSFKTLLDKHLVNERFDTFEIY